jgi:hypothetical protein
VHGFVVALAAAVGFGSGFPPHRFKPVVVTATHTTITLTATTNQRMSSSSSGTSLSSLCFGVVVVVVAVVEGISENPPRKPDL